MTASCVISKVTQRRAWSVPTWVLASDYQLDIKLRVYKAAILTAMFYGSESYRSHIKCGLRVIHGNTFDDRVFNSDLLEKCNIDGIENFPDAVTTSLGCSCCKHKCRQDT